MANQDTEVITTANDLNKHLDMIKFKILHDPISIEEGGFKPGAKVTPLSVNDMIRMGILQGGTVIENVKNGKRHIVKKSKRRSKFRNKMCLVVMKGD